MAGAVEKRKATLAAKKAAQAAAEQRVGNIAPKPQARKVKKDDVETPPPLQPQHHPHHHHQYPQHSQHQHIQPQQQHMPPQQQPQQLLPQQQLEQQRTWQGYQQMRDYFVNPFGPSGPRVP
jgi:hypothetical protein